MNIINEKTTLKFPDEFFKEEIRSEYKVTEKSKKIWAIQLDLLNKLLQVCEKHNIKVYAYAGTLLGAVRHKGFIPWDDDIDVCMTRENFDKFLKEADKEFKHPYFLQTALTDRQYFFAYARLRNSLTTGFITEYSSGNYNQGIYIDIFVLDGYTEKEMSFKRQIWLRNMMLLFSNAYKLNKVSKRFLVRILYKLLNLTICRILPYNVFVNAYNKNLSRYNRTASRLTMLTHSDYFIKRYICSKEDLLSSINVEFENITIPVPVGYKEILSNTYGDYMKLPPVESRGVWHSGQLEFDPDTPYKEYVRRKENEVL